MRILLSITLVTLVFVGIASAKDAPGQTIFTGCNIFDGKADKLAVNRSVLVEGNQIKRIGGNDLKAAGNAATIDSGKRTLMPGLSDTHVHITFATFPRPQCSRARKPMCTSDRRSMPKRC